MRPFATVEGLIDTPHQEMTTMPKICVEFDGDGGTPAAPVRSYGATVGDGTSTEFDIAHDLSTRDAFYSLRNITTGEVNGYDVAIDSSDPNTAVLTFATAPAAGSVRVNVLAAPVPVVVP